MAITAGGRLALEVCASRGESSQEYKNRNAWMMILATIELIGYVVSFALGLKWLVEGSQSAKLCMGMIIAPLAVLALPLIGISGAFAISNIQKAEWFGEDD